jgi:NitT/TauT family transport system substrate-binding protein
MTAYIKRGGGDATSVKFIEIPESTTVDALLQGRIAASYLDDPQYSAAKSQIRPLAAASDAIAAGKPFAETVWFTTKDWLAQNPALAHRIVGCLTDGGKWAMANPDAAARIIETRLGFKEAKAQIRFAVTNDPQIVQPLLDTAAELNVLPPIRAAAYFWDGSGRVSA